MVKLGWWIASFLAIVFLVLYLSCVYHMAQSVKEKPEVAERIKYNDSIWAEPSDIWPYSLYDRADADSFLVSLIDMHLEAACIATRLKPDWDDKKGIMIENQGYVYPVIRKEDYVLFVAFIEYLKKAGGIGFDARRVVNDSGDYILTVDSAWILPTKVVIWEHPNYYVDDSGKVRIK